MTSNLGAIAFDMLSDIEEMGAEVAFVTAVPMTLGAYRVVCRRNHAPPRCCGRRTSGHDALGASEELRALLSEKKGQGKGGGHDERTGRDAELQPLIARLEGMGELPDCATDELLLGTWRNAHTSRTTTASPIQRTVVRLGGVAPTIEQLILGTDGGISSLPPRYVLTRVDLRRSLGAILNVKASVTSVEGNRVNLLFDEAWFVFSQLPAWLGGPCLPVPIRVPYPVPFRLLGSKAAGWQNVTYLDHHLRISRGNRGSCFILTRVPPEDQLPITNDVRAACPSTSEAQS